MIPIDFYIAYVFATTALISIPGPIVTLTVASSLASGTKHGILTACGATFGTAVLLSIGSIGVTWLTTALNEWLTVLRWLGSAYLIFLGLKYWFYVSANFPDVNNVSSSIPAVLLRGFLVAVSNPKTVLFYAAFFPQFLDFSMPIGPQLWVLSITFVGIAFIIDNFYAIVAGHIRQWVSRTDGPRLQNKFVGVLFITTGVGMALLHHY